MVDGRYRMIDRIGSGGMADVYCAEDTQLGRRIALKLLYRRFAEDDEFVERFRREASSAAGLQHPNVVQVFDRGEWDGTYYIAMELLEGRNLKQVVRDHGALEPALAVDLVLQILKAARFAHRRGIVHRDIKPHNVIVDDEGRAKVTDFGIARAGASDMTETGSIMGTAQYLSPEQAQGHPVDARSDLYSIGIVLYELLTGAPAVRRRVARSRSRSSRSPRSRAAAAAQPGGAARARRRRACARCARTRRALPGRRRVRRRAGGTRWPAGYVETVAVAEDPVALLEEPRTGATGGGSRRSRSWRSRSPRVAIGAWLLLQPGARGRCPTWSASDPATAAQILQTAASRSTSCRSSPTPSPTTASPASARSAGDEADEGSVVTITVSSGPGEAPVPLVAGPAGRRGRRRAARGRLQVRAAARVLRQRRASAG